MFRLENVLLRFGPREIFKDLSWQVGTRDRIGLVGPNGAGKSTLLKLLCGLQECDKGTVFTGRGTTFGYLPQEGIVHQGRSLFEEARSVFEPLLALKRRQEQLHEALEHLSHDDPSFEARLLEVEALEDRFRLGGGYQMEAEVGNVLKGLGFQSDEWERPCESYSGGWQMRIALARLLLMRPNLLLLDEPTNHLDIEAREWLGEYLLSYPFAVVMVSHDRFFMDRVVTRIAEIAYGTIVDYFGGYSHFEKEKEQRRLAHIAAYQRQQEEIADIQTFIERFRYKATKASQVQSRIKMLEKLERIPPPPEPPRSVHFRFPEPLRSGDIVLELIGFSKRYGSNEVFKKADFGLTRGEKVALTGVNGAGKSTLMRLLAGLEPPDSGMRRLGHQVMPSYFAQDQARTMNMQNNVLQELAEAAPLAPDGQLRAILGGFLFTGDDVYKKVEVLSGGEKNRLALCKMLASPGNLLLMDEPTNHLDLSSKDVLLEALKAFAGTVVFVSHDRYFIDALATRVVDIGGGGLYDFPGTHPEFVAWKAKQAVLAAGLEVSGTTSKGAQAKTTPTPAPTPFRSEGADAHSERKRQQRQQGKLQKRLEQVQSLIEEREAQLQQVLQEMAMPENATVFARLNALEQKRQSLSAEIEALYEEWAELSEQV